MTSRPAKALGLRVKGITMNPQHLITDLPGLLSRAYPIPDDSSEQLDRAMQKLAEIDPRTGGKTNGAKGPRFGQSSPPDDGLV